MQIIYTSNSNLEWWLQETKLDIVTTDNVHDNYDTAMWETQDFSIEKKLELEFLISKCKLVCVFLPEFISDHWCEKFDLPNVIFFIGGILNWQPQHARVLFHHYFFWSTTDFYHTKLDVLSRVNNSWNKPKYFDVLLGRVKPHRSQIYDTIDHEQNIVTYFQSSNDLDLRAKPSNHFSWPHEILAEPAEEICWTGSEVVVDGTIVSLSQLVPIDIYNQTYYSLVAETQYENRFSFFTEKIVKPMMAGRMFVVSSGQYYLKNLKTLGFKTFDNVVDESYDLEPNLHQRTAMVLDQVEKLSRLNPVEVHSMIQHRLDHNKKLVLETKWVNCIINNLHDIFKKI